jgi:hypothetical protein
VVDTFKSLEALDGKGEQSIWRNCGHLARVICELRRHSKVDRDPSCKFYEDADRWVRGVGWRLHGRWHACS